MRSRRVAPLVALAATLAAATAVAQPPPPPFQPTSRARQGQAAGFASAAGQTGSVAGAPAPTSHAATSHELRLHFGAEIAARLLASPVAEERLRGLARAGAAGTDDALALLAKESERGSASRRDGKAMVALARALAAYSGDPAGRAALATVVEAETPSLSRAPAASVDDATRRDDAAHAARFELARETAAIALSATDDPKAIEALVTIVRRGGPGRAAAFRGLAVHPPSTPKSFASVALSTPEMVRLAATIGDLRTLEQIRGMLKVGDASLRSAAILAMADLGDMRALDAAAGAAATGTEALVRIAGVTALARLGASDAPAKIAALIGDDATAAAGISLAERVSDDGVVKALAARAAVTSSDELRAAAIAALGRSAQASAVKALLELLKDPSMRSDASDALARSPAPGAADALASMAVTPALKHLAVRAYVVRALTRGQTDKRLDAFVASLAQARDGADRALGVGAQIALGRGRLSGALADADPRVRRAAAIASVASGPTDDDDATLLDHMTGEKDAATRSVLAIGLLGGDAAARVPTGVLVERCDQGEPDAPLAALALARRGDDAFAAKVTTLLASADATTRAHVARGLSSSAYKDTVGRLSEAYAYEEDPRVRRVIIEALAARQGADADAPLRVETLRLAATLDPDGVVRSLAARARAGRSADAAPQLHGVEWLHVEAAAGGAVPAGLGAMFVRADALAVPIVFDDDGFAIVPGAPPGRGRVVLAPRLPAYESSAP